MEHKHSEKFVGVNGEDFIIRIIDYHSHVDVSINLMIEDNGEEREINIRRDKHPSGSDLNDLLEQAKKSIQFITVLRRYTK